jgi:hypothetical protein
MPNTEIMQKEKENVKKRILFWFGADFTQFATAYFLQDIINSDFYSIVDITQKPKKFFDEQNLIKFNKKWFLHEHIRSTNQKPDYNYLKKMEEKYGLNLWKVALNERQFYGFFNFHRFTKDEILLIIENELKIFENILDDVKPDILITKESTRHSLEIFCEMCRKKGVKVMALSSTKIGFRSMITNGISEFENIQNGKISKIENWGDAEKYLKSYDAKKYIGKYIKEHGKSKKKFVTAIIHYLFKNNNENIKTHYNYFGRTKFRVTLFMIKSIFKKKFREDYINKKLLKQIPNKTKFVYFPLGVDMERNLLISAPFFTNQIEIIRHIAKSLPADMTLVVKETPAQISREWRPISQYKEIQEIPNVILIHPDFPSEDIIKKTELVITVNGSSGIEALFFRKPSIIFSDTIYSFLPSVFRIKSLEDLPKIIRNALNIQVTLTEINNYVNNLEKNSFEFDWLGFSAEFKNKFYFEGGLVDVEISINGMKDFLESKKDDLKKLVDEYSKRIN